MRVASELMARLSAACRSRWTGHVGFTLGSYHGLTFGVERQPGGSADIFLEGQALRTTPLSKESQWPRAVMNALSRLAASYGERCESLEQELFLLQTCGDDRAVVETYVMGKPRKSALAA